MLGNSSGPTDPVGLFLPLTASVVDANLNDFTVQADNGFEILAVVLEVDFIHLLALVALPLDLRDPGSRVGGFDNYPDVGLADGSSGSGN